MSTAATPLAQIVFARLSDGECHSGEMLAENAGVTRSAIWKAIEQLRELGLEIEAHTYKGYRLTRSVEALEAARIRRDLADSVRERTGIEVVWEIDSTNAALLTRAAPEPHRYDVLLAENQTSGRGRRGRAWQARLGASLCLSIATSFDPLPRDLPALPLIVGLRVREALTRFGAKTLQLKWPNDLVMSASQGELAKIGGILVELRAEAGGAAHIVIGVGLNLMLDDEDRAAIAALGNTAASLADVGVEVGARNRLVAALIESCVTGLEQFRAEGFAPFKSQWNAADVLRNQPIVVADVNGQRRGVARGIDAQGALILERDDGSRETVIAGDVSVRR
jgi:BirA family biotin operon repressor/biotin-[acetyl-CoA-carboxylase] ligase